MSLKSSGYLAEDAPKMAAERMQEAMHELAEEHGTEVEEVVVHPDDVEGGAGGSGEAGKKRISQETFDEVVKENIEDFEMDPAEAVADAVQQFERQGVDLSNLVCRAPGAAADCPVTQAVEWLTTKLSSETGGRPLASAAGAPEEIVERVELIEAECKLSEEKKLVARRAGALDAVLDVCRALAVRPAVIPGPEGSRALASSLSALGGLFCKEAVNRVSVRDDFVGLVLGIVAQKKKETKKGEEEEDEGGAAATEKATAGVARGEGWKGDGYEYDVTVRTCALGLAKAACLRNEPNKAAFWALGAREVVVDTITGCATWSRKTTEAATREAVAAGTVGDMAPPAIGGGAATGVLAAASGDASGTSGMDEETKGAKGDAASSDGRGAASSAAPGAHATRVGGAGGKGDRAAEDTNTLQLLRSACVFLGVVFSDDDRREGISPETFKRAREAGDAGLLEPLFEGFAVAGVEASAGAVTDLCWAIKCVSVNDDICKKVATSGGLGEALRLFGLHQGAPRVARYACNLLKAVANNDDNKKLLCKHSAGLALVLAAIKRHLGDEAVLAQALAALSNFALRQPDNCRAIAAGDGIDLICHAMRRHPEVATVQRPACLALRNMATHRTAELRAVMLDAGAERLVRAARTAHPRACGDVAFGALRDLGVSMAEGGSEGKKE